MARISLVLAILFAMLATAAMPAAAQTRIVAVVNGSPITNYAVAQRQKLLRLTGQPGGSKAALDELINEAIQNDAVEKARLKVTDADVNAAIANIAKNAKISSAQLNAAFKQSGVSMSTLQDRIRAQVGFSRLVRARFKALATVTEQDLVAALLKDDTKEKSIDSNRYDLTQITIALPDDPSDQRIRQATARANDLRKRFTSCREGVSMAKKTRNVVVRDFGARMDVDFPPAVQELLAATPVGKLTEPFPQPRGMVMLAVCDKKVVKSTNAAMKKLEPDMTAARGDAFSKQYLRQLRRDAVIEIR
ncbi:peptidylprolyl isomerase [Acuticoccus sp. MNP-M23]|uniref:peptidylprolyl isomerase n=1 Tax=Acuticoccus sp. MNP-M23 TaxID=3072793 RepID=UPI0028165042|nr:peptidylprolyl isomerase [Acuticoccus sp. MNP-M23]WMS41281.1 peptidylprolyl isomerase [Acuticoccus sp. MNP-M23]